jgi:hypothetical protein
MSEDKTILLDPRNRLHIDQCWMFISVDEDGNEGACAAPLGEFGLVPLIACDEARLESLRPVAKKIAGMTGKTIKLISLRVLDASTPLPSDGVSNAPHVRGISAATRLRSFVGLPTS